METIFGIIVAPPGVMREGYQVLLSAIPEMEALEPVDEGPLIVETLDVDKPVIVVLDSSLSITEIKKSLTMIRSTRPLVRCIVISRSEWKMRELKILGAHTVLIEGCPPKELTRAIGNLVQEIKKGFG